MNKIQIDYRMTRIKLKIDYIMYSGSNNNNNNNKTDRMMLQTV